MKDNLKYTDEDDKCYGLTGMAISLIVWDAEELLASLELDGESKTIVLTPDFYFNGNPGVSAKLSWNHTLKHYQLATGMMISNVMCRRFIHQSKEIDKKLRNYMRDLIGEEGREACSLDEDEINQIFDKSYNYLYRLFNHRGVQELAQSFAAKLKERRTMTAAEVIEELGALSNL
jgi:hypothetical protein